MGGLHSWTNLAGNLPKMWVNCVGTGYRPARLFELRKRSSTRIVQAVPLSVLRVWIALGRPFNERTSTLTSIATVAASVEASS